MNDAPVASRPGAFNRGGIDAARNRIGTLRLQAILSEFEEACSRGETFSVQSLHEMHAITRYLQESGYSVETVRLGSKLVVEVEALEAVSEYEWSA